MYNAKAPEVLGRLDTILDVNSFPFFSFLFPSFYLCPVFVFSLTLLLWRHLSSFIVSPYFHCYKFISLTAVSVLSISTLR